MGKGHIIELPGEKSFPYLLVLLNGTFNQDVYMYGDTLEKVVAAYRSGETPEVSAKTKSDIERFLAERPDDKQLADDLEIYFKPELQPEGWEPGITNLRQWLTRVAQLLEAPQAVQH